MGWFLYDNGLRHERVKGNKNQFIHEFIVMLHKIADPIRKTIDPENGPQLNA